MYFISALLLSAQLVLASNVLELDSSTFDKYVGTGHPPSFVEFYAPWCGHCKNLAPTYENFADAFSHAKDKVQIIKVDADGAGKPVGSKYGVTGFPTLKWFPAGSTEPEDYKGGRELEDLVKFVTEKTGVKSNIKPPPPPITRVLTARDFDEVVMDPAKDVLVVFTAPWCGHCKALKPTLEILSTNFKLEKDCLIVNMDADNKGNADIVGRYDIQQYPTFKFFPRGSSDKKAEDYGGGRTLKDLTDLLNEKCGTHRSHEGGLNDKAGRIVDFDSLATQFINAVESERQAIYTRASDLMKDAQVAGEKTSAYGKHYLKVMDKLRNDSVEWLEKERARLGSILEKKKLNAAKLDEMKVKYNILVSFLEGKKDDAKTTAEEAKAHAEL